jgi:hypothetical protein
MGGIARLPKPWMTLHCRPTLELSFGARSQVYPRGFAATLPSQAADSRRTSRVILHELKKTMFLNMHSSSSFISHA